MGVNRVAIKINKENLFEKSIKIMSQPPFTEFEKDNVGIPDKFLNTMNTFLAKI